MKTTAKKIGAVALSLAMVVPMAVPALAADTHWIVASMDNQPVYNESYPEDKTVSDIELVDDLGVGVDIKISVNGKEVSTTRPVAANGVLENGTVYRLVENSDRSLTLSTTNQVLNDDIDIDIERIPIEYNINTNSGPQGFKDDLGSDSNPTCRVDTSADTVYEASASRRSTKPFLRDAGTVMSNTSDAENESSDVL